MAEWPIAALENNAKRVSLRLSHSEGQ